MGAQDYGDNVVCKQLTVAVRAIKFVLFSELFVMVADAQNHVERHDIAKIHERRIENLTTKCEE